MASSPLFSVHEHIRPWLHLTDLLELDERRNIAILNTFVNHPLGIHFNHLLIELADDISRTAMLSLSPALGILGKTQMAAWLANGQ